MAADGPQGLLEVCALATIRDTRRKELGEFLQTLRARAEPQAFGFPVGRRRRAKGLRREEVAQLTGISPTWYTWIEQGREVNCSAEVLDRLAAALKATRTERAYLFELAGRHDPRTAAPEGEPTPERFAGLLEEIRAPAYVMGRYWDLLAWNPQAAELFAGWLDRATPEQRPNLLRYVFLDPGSHELLADWEQRARRLVAEFRADCRSRLEEPALQRLVDELVGRSEAFAGFWKQHAVLERQGGARDFNHPVRGLVTYRQFTLYPVGLEQLKLVLLKPA